MFSDPGGCVVGVALCEEAKLVPRKLAFGIEKCGKGTTVMQLYRVEETFDQTRIHHLVFFDRHGWYCEHGKQCGVVKDVQKFTRSKLE